MLTAAIATIAKLVHGNSFLSGGLVLGTLGGAAAYARSAPGHVYHWAKRQVVTSVEINSVDESFIWFKHWMDNHTFVKKSRSLVLTTSVNNPNAPQNTDTDQGSMPSMPQVLLTPSPGFHVFKHEGRWFWIVIHREKSDKMGVISFYESFTLNTFFGNQEMFLSLVQKAFQMATKKMAKGIRVYRPVQWNGWRLCDNKKGRGASSLVLSANLYEKLEADIQGFLGKQSWYSEMGIPWRRGYLLYGPPGSGKSSIVETIASELDLSIYVLNLSNSFLENEVLGFIASVPKNAILLIEEIDTIFSGRRNADEGKDAPISFGSLLNAIDGVTAKEGRILFMTTNHPEQLDPALIRPGRVDMQLHIGNATQDQARRMFQKFFPGYEKLQLLDEALLGIPDESLSMATLQEHFMRYLEDPDSAIGTLPGLVSAQVTPATLPETESCPLAD